MELYFLTLTHLVLPCFCLLKIVPIPNNKISWPVCPCLLSTLRLDLFFFGSSLKGDLSLSYEVPNHDFCSGDKCVCFSCALFRVKALQRALACFTFVLSQPLAWCLPSREHTKDAWWTKGIHVYSNLGWQEHSDPPICPPILQVTQTAWSGEPLMGWISFWYKESSRGPVAAADISFQALHCFF